MINGITQIVMTKADILDSLEELKVCTTYMINGEEKNHVPFQMSGLDIQAIYKSFNGWNSNSTDIKHFKDMPENMKTYIEFINQFLGVSIKYISNGPGREQIVSV